MPGFPKATHITIVGGGKGAHVLAGLSSLVGNATVTVVSTHEDEAERWTAAASWSATTSEILNRTSVI